MKKIDSLYKKYYYTDNMKGSIRRKNYYLDTAKINKAKRILHAKTETDTIHQALDLVTFQKEILDSLDRTKGKWGSSTVSR